MAHFAQLDSDNTVISVIVVSNDLIIDPDTGLESEQLGIDFCKSLLGEDTRWVQTSYNNNIRQRYAPIGGRYDPDHDIFIPPPPFPSWSYNFLMHQWEAPVSKPDDGLPWYWNETTCEWLLPSHPELNSISEAELKLLSQQIAESF